MSDPRKYRVEVIRATELELHLNRLAEAGWRLRSIEWQPAPSLVARRRPDGPSDVLVLLERVGITEEAS